MAPSVTYDDAAFSFFAITLLVFYVVPAGWYILSTVSTWRPPPPPEHEVSAGPRGAGARG